MTERMVPAQTAEHRGVLSGLVITGFKATLGLLGAIAACNPIITVWEDGVPNGDSLSK